MVLSGTLGFEMTDQATPNLPSRDFDSTAAFYERLGFGIVFRDAGWMILQRGDLMLEFFAHPHGQILYARRQGADAAGDSGSSCRL